MITQILKIIFAEKKDRYFQMLNEQQSLATLGRPEVKIEWRFDDVEEEDKSLSYRRKFIDRGNLKAQHVKLLLWHRYGSATSFKEIIASYSSIARVTGVRACTVRNVIERYHANGNRFTRNWGAQKNKSMIPRHAAEWLCDWKTLYDMRYLPMPARARVCK